MKKGRKIAALLLALAAAGVVTAGFAACDGNDPDTGKQEQSTVAEKLKDGGAIVFTDGTSAVDLSQYVKANGNAFRATSSNPNAATATVSGSTLTVTAAGEGTAVIMVVCGDVQITFSVTTPKVYYTVTLDGEPVSPAEGEQWESGSVYVLPAAKQHDDPNMEFKGWSVNGETMQANASVTVDRNLTIVAVFERKAAQEVSGHALSVSLNEGKTATVNVSDYILAFGREVSAASSDTDTVTASILDGAVKLSGIAAGDATLTLSTDGVTVELAVHVLSADMPAFPNGTINIDLFTASDGSYTFEPNEPAGHTYSYEYTLQTQNSKVSIADGALTFDASDYVLEEDEDTVSLVVNAAVTVDGKAGGNVSFTVTVRICDTAPAAPVFGNVSVTINPISADETKHSYTLVLREDDEDFTYEYEIDQTKLTQDKVYTAEANETVRVTYTYKGNPNKSGTVDFTVTVAYDRYVYQMENGGFEDGKSGWTGATGILSSAGTYWDKGYAVNNDGEYYVGIDVGTETITSPKFLVGGSGWITFGFGSARPIEGDALRNVYLEFYAENLGGGTATKIAEVRNVLWFDPDTALKLNDYKLDLSGYMGKAVYVKAVDNESGDNFRSIYLDKFVTYWESAPTDAKYTDLTGKFYHNLTANIDLKDANTVTLNPIVASQGLLTETAPAFTATVDKAGLTADQNNPFALTASKSGTYTVTYQIGEETAFTATVIVTNTAELPSFADMRLMVKTGESNTLSLPAPDAGSRFTYAYSVTESGASVEENVFTFDAAGVEEGIHSVQITVTITDTKWGSGGDTFEKTFAVAVTVYGEKIVGSEQLSEGKATLAIDAYEVKKTTPDAVSQQIDFTKYLIIPEGITVSYTVTRKIGAGTAESVAAVNGVYALPFADCDLTVNHTETVVFGVTATNGEDSTNSVEFTITVSVKDTTQNRVVNGDFETGDMTGWTTAKEGFNLNTCVISAETYWNQQLPYNQGGNYHLDGWNTGIGEDDTWSVKSSSFVLGGSGWISVRMGGHAAAVKVYKQNGELIGHYKQSRWADVNYDNGFLAAGGSWADMATYAIDLSAFIGEELYIELCDEAVAGWAQAFFDEVITYYETAPDWEHNKETVINAHRDGEPRDENDLVDIPWIKPANEYVAPSAEE